MQIRYDLLKHSTARDPHTLFGVACWFSFHSLRQWFPQVSSDKKHGSWQFVLWLQFVFWEYLTSFPEISAFLVQNSTGWAEPRALPGTGWYTAGAHSSGPGSHGGAQGTSLLSQLLLKSHQVCRNLLFVTLAGCTQMLKPQHRIHPIASLKLVWISFLRVREQEEVRVLRVVSHHHHPADHRHILIWRWLEMFSFCSL